MKKRILLLLLVLPVFNLYAQYESIVFDYELAYFNNGQPLPAEAYMMLSGEVEPSTDRIEVEIFRSKSDMEKSPLFVSAWKRTASHQGGTYRLPLNYLLKGSNTYSFRFSYFRSITEAERTALKQAFSEMLDSYLSSALVLKGTQVQVQPSPKKVHAILNTMMAEGLYFYRNSNETPFPGFSDLVKDMLTQIGSGQKNKADFDQQLSQLKKLVNTEVEQILNLKLVIRSDVREVYDYPTEKIRNTLAINAGYGGVFLEGNQEKFTYGTAPYVGISLPIAKSALAASFWQNTSLSLGVFTNNFKQEEIEFTGPIFGRPYYAGLGYNVFRFIRINAGVTALETRDSSSIGEGTVSLNVDAIKLRPFVGISAEINIWAGLKQQ